MRQNLTFLPHGGDASSLHELLAADLRANTMSSMGGKLRGVNT
jgi:hypothetical protein